MKYSKLVLVLLLVFGTGYGVGAKLGLGPSSAALPVDCVAAQGESPGAAPAPMGARVDPRPVVSAASASAVGKAASAKAGVAVWPNTSSDAKASAASDGEPEQVAQDDSKPNKYEGEISDEEVDRVLPPVFATRLKQTHGTMRQKYKAFAAASQQERWDMAMQENIYEFILRGQYAKFMKLDGLRCAANFCELRLYESKAGVWNLINAEMALQPWWDIGNVHSAGFTPEGGAGEFVAGYFVMLSKRDSSGPEAGAMQKNGVIQ